MPPPRVPTTPAIYARLSQDRSGESLGIDRQRELCEGLAAQRGWPTPIVYVDRDRSAYSGKQRPAFSQLMSAIEAGAVDAILCVDQDRLVRRISELARVLDVCEHEHVPIVLLSGEIDTSSADGRLRAQILGSVAEFESRKKSERERRQREQAARLGKYMGGRRPYGYLRASDAKSGRGGIEIDRAEAKIIREAAKRFLAGDSLRQIALDLNRRGVAASSGGTWSVTSLRSMLGSPRLAGLRVHRGEVVGEAEWPPILDVDTHARLLERLGDVRRPIRGRPPVALLSGILICGKCGAGMVAGRRQDGSRRYVCYRAPGHNGCGALAIKADWIEDFVTEMVFAAVGGRKFKSTPGRTENRVERELEDIEARENSLARLYAIGDLGESEWLLARAELRARRDALGAPLHNRLAPTALNEGKSLRKHWPELGQDERREVLAFVLESVPVNRSRRGSSKRFDPARIGDPVWRI